MMTHTVHVIESGVAHRLLDVPDDAAQDIMKWWMPAAQNPAIVPEYFSKILKTKEGALIRALLLRRSGISAIDIQPNTEQPSEPADPTDQPQLPAAPENPEGKA